MFVFVRQSKVDQIGRLTMLHERLGFAALVLAEVRGLAFSEASDGLRSQL